jgi:hypothetical protein
MLRSVVYARLLNITGAEFVVYAEPTKAAPHHRREASIAIRVQATRASAAILDRPHIDGTDAADAQANLFSPTADLNVSQDGCPSDRFRLTEALD